MVEQFASTHLLTITFGLSIYNFNFGKTYNFNSHVNLRKNVFLYKKYLRDYIQLYSQLYLSEAS